MKASDIHIHLDYSEQITAKEFALALDVEIARVREAAIKTFKLARSTGGNVDVELPRRHHSFDR